MIHIVTDTTAYLPPAIREAWSIHTVPLKVNMGAGLADQ
ncbi:MAG: DegV family protein, partial [Chloroflexi bacterium]|nr:DegV family protein [Chloroflexota bacterium]